MAILHEHSEGSIERATRRGLLKGANRTIGGDEKKSYHDRRGKGAHEAPISG